MSPFTDIDINECPKCSYPRSVEPLRIGTWVTRPIYVIGQKCSGCGYEEKDPRALRLMQRIADLRDQEALENEMLQFRLQHLYRK